MRLDGQFLLLAQLRAHHEHLGHEEHQDADDDVPVVEREGGVDLQRRTLKQRGGLADVDVLHERLAQRGHEHQDADGARAADVAVAQRLLVADGLAQRVDDEGDEDEDRQIGYPREHREEVGEAVVGHHLEGVRDRVLLGHGDAQPDVVHRDGGVRTDPLDGGQLRARGAQRCVDVVGAHVALREVGIHRLLCLAPARREARGDGRKEADDQRHEVEDVDNHQMLVESSLVLHVRYVCGFLFCKCTISFLKNK